MKNKLCGAFLLAAAVLHCVLGDYELEVRLHEYENPSSRCGSCGCDDINGSKRMRCCDHNGIVEECLDGNRCDNYFVHCFRESGSDGPCISNEFNSSIFFDTNYVQFPSNESSINVTMEGAWEGIQFYTDVMDDDAGMFQLIDNFTIDLNTSFLIPGAGFTARTVYNGVFGLGQLDLSFRVSCADNFFGSDCETECIPPNNYTTCDDDGTSVCLPGFTGANCMTNIDECSINDVCGPNGQCVDGINTFTCQCSPGFTGANCTTDINDCEPGGVDCGNGTCRDTGTNKFICQCDPGFTGERCSTEINECQGINCSGNGQCIAELASISCNCNAGFTGERCETEIDECLGIDCGGNGHCIDELASFSCDCNAGYTGERCETEIDECQDIDCSGNGQCIDELASFSCDCDAGFTGECCETEIDECLGIDCSGSGQCIAELASFSCDCNAGFTGERCETDIDDCASANCSENSRCVDGVNSFSCVCSTGFSGDLCEAQVGTNIPENPFVVIWVSLGATLGFIALVLILLALCLLVVVRKVQRKRRVTGFYDVSTKEDIIAGDSGSCDSTLRYQPPQSVSNIDPSNGAAAEHSFRNPIYGPHLEAGDYECNPIV